jgi:peptide/nickel transport system substrate-binding protein
VDSNYWHRYAAPRISRRRLLGGVVVGGVGAVALACGGGNGAGGRSSGGESAPGAAPIPSLGDPKPGGVMLLTDNVVATHRSPYHSGNESSLVRPLWQSYYDALWIKMARGGDPVKLEFAEAVEQVSATQVNVKLRRGVKFHNMAPVSGREVTAEDVVQDIQFLQDPKNNANLNTTFIRNDLDGPPTAIDNYTLTFRTKGPRAYFFDTDQVAVSIVPKEMLSESTLRQNTQVGSGPWMFKAESQGSTYEAERNPAYRIRGKPYLEGIKLTIIPDRASQEAAFRSGQVYRYAFTDVRNRDAVVRDLGKQVYVYTQRGVSNVGLVLNTFRREFQDVRVREAIWKSIDRQRLINVVAFGDATLSGYFPYMYEVALPAKEAEANQVLDLTKARQLLSAAQFPLDKRFEMPLPVEAQFYVDAGRLMAEDLSNAGIKVNLSPIPRTQYIQRVGAEPGDFDISMWPFQGTNFRQQFRLFHSKEGSYQETFSLNDPEIDALVEKSETLLDQAQYIQTSHQIQRLLFQKYSNWVPTYSQSYHTGYWAFVRGEDFGEDYVPSPSGGRVYQLDRWLDKKS